jgi:hypothetical protein
MKVTKTCRKYYTIIHSDPVVGNFITGKSDDQHNQEASSAFFVRGDCQLSEKNEPSTRDIV